MAPPGLRPSSFDREEFHIEEEGSVGWDHTAGTAGAVREGWREYQTPESSLPHSRHALVPPRNHLPSADPELEGVAADTAIELAPVRKPARIVDGDDISLRRLTALSDPDILNEKTGWSFLHRLDLHVEIRCEGDVTVGLDGSVRRARSQGNEYEREEGRWVPTVRPMHAKSGEE